jgi:hypothetical protein
VGEILNLKCLHIKTQRKYFSSLIKAGLVGGVQTLQIIVVLKVISWFALLKYGRYMASLDFVFQVDTHVYHIFYKVCIVAY